MYRRARYYDPMVGQFTQIDPIGFGGGLNLYGYANGDPVNYGDPSGLAACVREDGTAMSLGECDAGIQALIDDGYNVEVACRPWPECEFQMAADWWARRGGTFGWVGLQFAALGNGLSEAANFNSFGENVGEGDVGGALIDLATVLPVTRVGRASTALVPRLTRHARFRMALRGIRPGQVDYAIEHGARFWDPKNGVVSYVITGAFSKNGKDLLVSVNGGGQVTTVLRGNNLIRPRFIPYPF